MENTGAGYILNVVKEAEDALDGISTVQQDNIVRISSMQPALPMLDLHGVTRSDVHASLFRTMQDKLLNQVKGLESRGLTKLLDRCFRYIGAEEQLRLVCLSIMEKLPSVDSKYLSHIAEHHDLYTACPLEVKRQIWQANQGLFGEAVSPLLDQYVAEKESILCCTTLGGRGGGDEGTPTSFLSLLPKVRRQSSILHELVEMVGNSQALYNTLLQFLRTLFLRTQTSHYCTLRADIVMCLHDSESSICSSDRCYKFAWCLDACVRVGYVDEKKGRELYSFLEALVGGDEILGDVAMLLRDPYALHTLCKSIISNLMKLMESFKLPRESSELECLVRLLQLSQKAQTIIESRDYYEDKLDMAFMVKFCPDLVSLMVENSLRAIHRQLKEDHTAFTPPTTLAQFLCKHSGAMLLTCSYTLQILDKKDIKALTLLLPSIAKAFVSSDSISFPDLFLHLLVLGMVVQEDVLKEGALLVILRDFWIPCCQSSEQVLLHLFRVLWFLHAKVSQSLLREVLELVEPGKDVLLLLSCTKLEHQSGLVLMHDESSNMLHEQYQALLDHIQTSSTV